MGRNKIVLAKFGLTFHDELNHWNDFIRSQSSHYNCLLQEAEIVPFSRPWVFLEVLRVGCVINTFPMS